MEDNPVYQFDLSLKILLDGNEIPDDTPITFIGPDGNEVMTIPYSDAKEWHNYTENSQSGIQLRVETIPR